MKNIHQGIHNQRILSVSNMYNSTFYPFSHALEASTLNETTLRGFLSKCYEIIPNDSSSVPQLNEFGRLSEVFKPHWLELYDFFFDVIMVGTILLAGMTGNVLSCLVLLRDRSHGTTSLILTSLAICDTLFLLGCLFFQFLRTLSYFTLWINYMNLYANISKILYGSGMAARMTRNWMVVLVSTERWVAVCKPLHAPSICTRKKARMSILVLAIFCFTYNLPNFFIVDAITLFCSGSPILSIDTTGSTNPNLPLGIIIYHSALRKWVENSYLFKLIYRLISYTILIVILPNVIICVLNVLLIRGIKYANARRAQIMARVDCANRRQFDPCSYTPLRKETSSAMSENHAYFVRVEKSTRSRTGEVNRLCVGVIIIYLICELPAVGYQVIHLLQHRGAIEITKPVTNALVCLNSGVNFFVYVFLGRRFRSQLKVLLRPLFCGECRPEVDESDHGHIVNSQSHYLHHHNPHSLVNIPASAKINMTFPMGERRTRGSGNGTDGNQFENTERPMMTHASGSPHNGHELLEMESGKSRGCRGRFCKGKQKRLHSATSICRTSLTEVCPFDLSTTSPELNAHA